MCNKLINFVDIKTMVCSRIESAYRIRYSCRFVIFFTIQPRCQSDSRSPRRYTGSSYRHIDMYVVNFSVAAYEISERYESGYTGNGCQEHQRNSHSKRSFVRSMFEIRFIPPENTVIQTEHIKCGKPGNKCHPDTHIRTKLDAALNIYPY